MRQTSKSIFSFRRWKHLGVRSLKEELLILQGSWEKTKKNKARANSAEPSQGGAGRGMSQSNAGQTHVEVKLNSF